MLLSHHCAFLKEEKKKECCCFAIQGFRNLGILDFLGFVLENNFLFFRTENNFLPKSPVDNSLI